MSFAASQHSRRLAVAGLVLLAGALGWWIAGARLKTGPETPVQSAASPPFAAGSVTRELDSLLEKMAAEKSSSRQFALLADAPPPRTAGAMRAWLDRIEQLPNVESRELAEQLLFRNGVDVPFEAMVSVLSPTDYRAIASLGRAWAEREGIPGLTRALTRSGAPLPASLISVMAKVCAQTDPQGTFDLLLQQRSTSPAAANGLGSVLAEWVKHDPNKVTAAIAALPEADRQSASWSLAYAWAQTDPQKALAWAESQDNTVRSALVEQICQVWATTAPDLAADALVKNSPNQMDGSSLFYTWSENDAQGMLAWVNAQTELPTQTIERLMGIAASALAPRDPDHAWGLVKDLPADQRSHVLSSISRSLFTQDPAGAMAWAGQLTDPSDRERFVMGMVDMPGRITPEHRQKILDALPDTEPGAATVKMSLLAKTDAAAARQYWDTLSADHRASILRQGIGLWGESAPDLASTLIHEKLTLQAQASAGGSTPEEPGQNLGFEASRVAVYLGNRDPESAKTWISSLPAGPVAADAAANFASNHGRFDRASIESWLSAQPDDSAVRSGLLRGLARLDTSLGDPSAAFDRVRQLDPTDPGRPAALRELFAAWQETEPEQAVKAFDSLPLTAPERAQLGLPEAP